MSATQLLESQTAYVDVVLDIATTHLDAPFTYAVAGEAPQPGTRVRVPFGKRWVNGWVIGPAATVEGTAHLKLVERVYDKGSVLPESLHLAQWLSTRWACTLREALMTVSTKAPRPSERFIFLEKPAGADLAGRALHARLQDKEFSALTAARELRRANLPKSLDQVRRLLNAYVSRGVASRVARERGGKKSRPSNANSIVVLGDASRGRGAGQQRLARVLRDAGGSLRLFEARVLARISSATVRSSCARGMTALTQREPRAQDSGAPLGRDLVATPEQREAIARLDAAVQREHTCALLQGVTGSGKTFVYLALIDRLRSRGGRAIMLVPEIALTPQTSARFVERFGHKVGVLHSGLSDASRAQVWEKAANGELDVVIGARSAVFAPLPRLALIVVDEEHEESYKQDVAPRYHAPTVAVERMRRCGGSVVLGSATPSLETYWGAQQGDMMHVRLSGRATAAPLPAVEVVDMRSAGVPGSRRALGPALIAAIEGCLKAKNKALLFVNRRGYAGLLLCRACGFAPRCRRCAVSLVLHAADRSLRCHTCGDAFRLPLRCPKCASHDLRPFGFGTQRLEEEVRELFPSARVVRMDSDSTAARGAHERLLSSFAREGNILIGTQMVAKGLDYPAVTLVGVVAADQDLNRPDFRASERVFALLTQVAGRAGRSSAGRVIAQTYAPEHYAIALASKHDYDGFAQRELHLRKELAYPPFGRLAYVVVAGAVAEYVAGCAGRLADELRASAPGVELLGPAPDAVPKARGEFRMRLALKAGTQDELLSACRMVQTLKIPAKARLAIDIDPR